MKILHVVGARPNFMKVAPHLSRGAGEQGSGGERNELSPAPLPLRTSAPLGVGFGSHAQQTARIMLALWNRPLPQSLSWNMTYSTGLAFEPVLLEHRPDWVIVAST